MAVDFGRYDAVQVRPSFLRVSADRALKHGALINDAGEVCTWAELRHGEPYLVTKPDRDMDAVIQDLLYRGYTIDSIIGELQEGTTDPSHADVALHG